MLQIITQYDRDGYQNVLKIKLILIITFENNPQTIEPLLNFSDTCL